MHSDHVILCILHINNNMSMHCSLTQTFFHMAIRAKFNLWVIITVLGEVYLISNLIVLQMQGMPLFYSPYIYCPIFSIFSLAFHVLRTFHPININISYTLSCTLKLCTKIVCKYTTVVSFFPSRFCSISVSFLLHLVSLIVYNYFT